MFSSVRDSDVTVTQPVIVILLVICRTHKTQLYLSHLTMNHDEDHPMNNANDHEQQSTSSSSEAVGNDDNAGTTHAETYVFTGNGGPAFLATVQNLVNRIIMRDQQPGQRQNTSAPSTSQSTNTDAEMRPTNGVADLESDRSTTSPTTTTGESQGDAATHSPTVVPSSIPSDPINSTPSSNEPVPESSAQNTDPSPNTTSHTNPSGRPVRPLPRPHSHFHAHTPIGVIDLFTFNVGVGATPPPAAPGTATFTFNLGPEAFAGLEAMFMNNMQKEREPDPERAKTLLRGMQVVPEGLVRRLERAGGVPGGQGSEDHSSGCAVCWGALLEGVEPGEWDSAAQKEEKEKRAAGDGDAKEKEEDEFRGRIVALPCAHVYHAECLLPWFSRNTTCPTCRFDIDPDSLTWNPQPPPPPPETEPPASESIPNLGGYPLNFTREDIERANASEAERFNTFVTSLFTGHAGNNGSGAQSQRQPRPQQSGQEEGQQAGTEPPPASSQSQHASVPNETPAEIVSGQTPSAAPTPSSTTLPAPSSTPQPFLNQPPAPSNPPQTYGPTPPPPPPPRLHGLSTLFRLPPVPLFFIPTRTSDAQTPEQTQPQPQPQQPQAQPELTPQQQPENPTPEPTPTQPIPETPNTTQLPQPQHQPQHQHRFPPFLAAFPHLYPAFHVFPAGGAPGPVHGHPRQAANTNMNLPPHPPPYSQHFANRAQQRERRKWVPPEPVGRTLRQRVEAKERELGLRCDDVVCLIAPTDDDPTPVDSLSEETRGNLKRRVQLHGAYDARGRACEHSFHPACLVASARVAGLDGHGHIYEDEAEDGLDSHDRETQMDTDAEEDQREHDLELSCPVCRADGTLHHQEWQEGVNALQQDF